MIVPDLGVSMLAKFFFVIIGLVLAPVFITALLAATPLWVKIVAVVAVLGLVYAKIKPKHHGSGGAVHHHYHY